MFLRDSRRRTVYGGGEGGVFGAYTAKNNLGSEVFKEPKRKKNFPKKIAPRVSIKNL